MSAIFLPIHPKNPEERKIKQDYFTTYYFVYCTYSISSELKFGSCIDVFHIFF